MTEAEVWPIEDNELDDMEMRAAAATPGPWRDFIEARDDFSGNDFIETGGGGDGQPDMYVRLEAAPAPAADLEFIAHARQDVPRLVAEVRRLRALLQEGSGRP
ncbi:MAG: hypothetical protein ACRD2W_18895 [Acidimicrobiales bacterium]